MTIVATDAAHIARHHPSLTDTQARVYAEWKRCGIHGKEYAAEAIGTAWLVMAIVLVVGIFFGKISPVVHALPNPAVRRILAGLLIGASGGLVAISPLGRLSGAHLNPAVTLGFFMLKKMHRRDAAAYMVFQMLGGVAGVAIARGIAPGLCRSVDCAVLVPAPILSTTAVAALEAAVTFVLCGAIFLFVSTKTLMRFTPLAVIVCAGMLNLLDGSLSGFGANPARWFGPAVIEHAWRLGACYLLGPMVGGLLAAPLPQLVGRLEDASHRPHTGKLFHDPGYRSIFVHDTEPSLLPNGLAQA